MKDIKILRKDLDEIDKQIVSLMEKRYNISSEVAEYKIANSKKVYDKKREDEVILSRKNSLNNHKYDDFIAELYEKIMEQSREIQLDMVNKNQKDEVIKEDFVFHPKIAYCGVKGSYAYQGIGMLFKDEFDEVSTSSFEDAFLKIKENKSDYALIPIENSSTGSINDVYDLLFKYNFKICGEVKVKIDHALIGKKGTDIKNLRKIYSHIQGLNQCEDFLNSLNYTEKIPFYNTAGAAKYVSESDDYTIAAVASKKTADIYGLEILKEDISTRKNNYTRFVLIAKNHIKIENADKISMAFTLSHTKGSLFKVLSVFAKENLNLVKIESRPCEDKNWEYLFFLDFIINEDTDIRNLLEKIRPMTKEMEYLGNYRSYFEK